MIFNPEELEYIAQDRLNFNFVFAIDSGQLDAAKELYEAGADPNTDDGIAMVMAKNNQLRQGGYEDVIAYLEEIM
jgi:hypothetical protein